MPGFQKQSIINGHVFYIKQTKTLLIKQFDELNRPERQIQVINEWLSDNQHRFNPDYHDSSDFYDEAFEQLLALTELGEQIRLSIAAMSLRKTIQNIYLLFIIVTAQMTGYFIILTTKA